MIHIIFIPFSDSSCPMDGGIAILHRNVSSRGKGDHWEWLWIDLQWAFPLKQQVDPNHATAIGSLHWRIQIFRSVLLECVRHTLAHLSRTWWGMSHLTIPICSTSLCRWFLHHWTVKCAFIFVMRAIISSLCDCLQTLLTESLITSYADILSHLRKSRSSVFPHISVIYEHRNHQMRAIDHSFRCNLVMSLRYIQMQTFVTVPVKTAGQFCDWCHSELFLLPSWTLNQNQPDLLSVCMHATKNDSMLNT